jgi:cytochrome P450
MPKPDELQSVDEISFLDPHISSNPYRAFELLQRDCPVYRMPETGAYMVTRYEDVRRVLRDYETFSNRPASTSGMAARGNRSRLQAILRERGWEHVETLQRTDPPVHTRYRKLVDRVFTAKRVQEMAPYIDGVAAELIDRFIDDGTCDFNSQFAMPMPGIIIAEQLGLDRSEVARFKRWADAMLGVSYTGGPVTEEQALANAELELEAQHYLAAVFEDRRANPRDDLMSRLVHAHGDDEEPLTMHELQNIMHQLVTGGFETTQSAINHGMWTLIRYPELVPRLYAHPELMRPFVEEVLRWESPVVFLFRSTTRDVELGGTVIPEGATVMVGFGPANRDPARFSCPHEFNLDRDDVQGHLAFGSGHHYCPGAVLARQEMYAAFTQIVKRMQDIELAAPLPDPVHYFSLPFLPMHDFHIRFRKRQTT